MPVLAVVTFTAGVFVLGALDIVHPATAAARPVATCTMMINAGACLDPSNIDDLRTRKA